MFPLNVLPAPTRGAGALNGVQPRRRPRGKWSEAGHPLGTTGLGSAWRSEAVGAARVSSLVLGVGRVDTLAGLLEQKVEEGGKELQCIKTTLLASMQGYNPSTAIEFGRKVLFSTERPSFSELESHVRGKK